MSDAALWFGPVTGRYVLVNLVSAFRIVAAVIALGAIAFGIWWPIASLFLLAGLASDFVDGYLARKWQVTSGFGAIWDAQTDRLLLISPILGMGVYGDIPRWLTLVLIAGLYAADEFAEHFELMRVVWWPLCYATILYGLVRHATIAEVIFLITIFAIVTVVILATHTSEIKRVWRKLSS
jgi:phosphatidylglycerophosphate synthase